VKSTDSETLLYVFIHPSALRLLTAKYSPQQLLAGILIARCAVHPRDTSHNHMQQERTYNFGALLMIVKSTKTCQTFILDLP